jgi:hypothetical protein
MTEQVKMIGFLGINGLKWFHFITNLFRITVSGHRNYTDERSEGTTGPLSNNSQAVGFPRRRTNNP